MVILSDALLFAASRAVTVMMLFPTCKLIFETDQLVLPDAVPEPPLLFTQVTPVTLRLSAAEPAMLMMRLEVA